MNKGITNAASQPGPVWLNFLKMPEGIVLLLGIALTLAGLIVLGLVAYWSFPISRMMGAMAVSAIMFGRAVSMSIGYAGGYGHFLVVSVNMWVETVLVLLFYPIFVLSLRKLVVFPKLGRLLERTHDAAEKHQGNVRRYGIFGLFMFVWLPFWMTGPVVGSAIGYLIGLPTWVTMAVVLISDYLAIATWAYLLLELYTRAAAYGSWAPALIIGMVILILFVAYILRRRKTRKAKKDN